MYDSHNWVNGLVPTCSMQVSLVALVNAIHQFCVVMGFPNYEAFNAHVKINNKNLYNNLTIINYKHLYFIVTVNWKCTIILNF